MKIGSWVKMSYQSISRTSHKGATAYGLDDLPPLPDLILFGLQWFAVGIPSVVVIGKIVTGLDNPGPQHLIIYLQKLLFLTGLAILAQILAGHRMPIILGPSTVLIISIAAGRGSGSRSIYTSILVGGLFLFMLSITGLFGKLRKLFTPRITVVVLLLVAFTLLPSILGLLGNTGAGVLFSLLLTFSLFFLYKHLKGLWRLTLLLWGMAGGSIIHLMLFPQTSPNKVLLSFPVFSLFFNDFVWPLSFDPVLTVAFLFSFVALSINDVGSVYSIQEVATIDHLEKRVNRAITITGIANAISGFFGVIGPVNYSMSPGVVMATGCASRHVLVPAAFLFILVSFSPTAISLLAAVPAPVVAAILLYVLCAQVSTGLLAAFRNRQVFSYDDGLVIGMPLLFGSLVSFLPAPIQSSYPPILKPLICNGFVVGITAAVVLEHIVFRRRSP